MRVAIVHDYVTQKGGAERVALALLQAFPGSRLITSVYDPERTFPEFRDHEIHTLWPDGYGFLKADPRRALPVLARAFGRHEVHNVDAVICSSSGWAHGVKASAPKIVYCHNPARWLYQPEHYLPKLPHQVLPVWARATASLRRWDQVAAASAARYLVNSSVVAHRVEAAYGISPQILPPPVVLDPEGPQEAVPDLEPGYLLTVGRRRGYKNTDVAAEAVAETPGERLVVVGGLPDTTRRDSWPANVIGLRDVSDAQLRWLYANCAAVVAVSFEDFGLTPVEGFAFGKPAIALRYGGYLDTMVEGQTGEFVDELEPAALQHAIGKWRNSEYDSEFIRGHAQWYSMASFARQLTTVVQEACGIIDLHRNAGDGSRLQIGLSARAS